MAIDQEKLNDLLGLYKALAAKPMNSKELAAATRTDERYVREWLSSQAAGGYVQYNPLTRAFSLSEEQAFALAEEGGPAYCADFLFRIDAHLHARVPRAGRLRMPRCAGGRMQPQGRGDARRVLAIPPRHRDAVQHGFRSPTLKGISMRLTLYSLTAIASATLFAMPLAHAQAVTLDGKVFVADAGEKGRPADEKADVITFAGSQFHSSLCDQYGYGKGDYRYSSAGDAITFEAQTQSEKDGRPVWKGTVRGDAIEGTFVHYRKGWMLNPNPEPVEHWFKGKVKS